jgi:hypothetical protein
MPKRWSIVLVDGQQKRQVVQGQSVVRIFCQHGAVQVRRVGVLALEITQGGQMES